MADSAEGGIIPEASGDLLVSSDRLLAPVQLFQCVCFVVQRFGDWFAQLGREVLAEAGEELVVGSDLLLGPVQLPQRGSLVEQRPGDQLAQLGGSSRADAGNCATADTGTTYSGRSGTC